MIWVGRWRLPRCQPTLTRCCGSAALISASGSGAATTSTSLPSSSTSASPPRSATALSRSSKNSSPRVPVIAIRRRWRSSKSSTTVSAGGSLQRYWPRTCVARIMRKLSQLLDLAVADDLDHGRRNLQRCRIFAPHLHMRRAGVGVKVLAAFPAFYHDEQIGIVDAGMALIRNAALFLHRGGDAFLGALDKSFPRFRLHLRGGNNIDHGLSPGFCFGFRVPGTTLVHEIALRHRQHFGRRTGEEFAIGAHLIGFGIDLDLGCGAVVDHALFGDAVTGILDGVELLADAELPAEPGRHRRL